MEGLAPGSIARGGVSGAPTSASGRLARVRVPVAARVALVTFFFLGVAGVFALVEAFLRVVAALVRVEVFFLAAAAGRALAAAERADLALVPAPFAARALVFAGDFALEERAAGLRERDGLGLIEVLC